MNNVPQAEEGEDLNTHHFKLYTQRSFQLLLREGGIAPLPNKHSGITKIEDSLRQDRREYRSLSIQLLQLLKGTETVPPVGTVTLLTVTVKPLLEVAAPEGSAEHE